MKAFFENIEKYLPLDISFCKVEEYYISFGSENWNFYSDSNWRFIKTNRIISSSSDFVKDNVKNLLLGNRITSIKPLSINCLDPVFYLEDSVEFQVFSETNDEPWKITLPDAVYVPYG